MVGPVILFFNSPLILVYIGDSLYPFRIPVRGTASPRKGSFKSMNCFPMGFGT